MINRSIFFSFFRFISNVYWCPSIPFNILNEVNNKQTIKTNYVFPNEWLWWIRFNCFFSSLFGIVYVCVRVCVCVCFVHTVYCQNVMGQTKIFEAYVVNYHWNWLSFNWSTVIKSNNEEKKTKNETKTTQKKRLMMMKSHRIKSMR